MHDANAIHELKLKWCIYACTECNNFSLSTACINQYTYISSVKCNVAVLSFHELQIRTIKKEEILSAMFNWSKLDKFNSSSQHPQNTANMSL